jgi:hypothetical protein
MIHARPAQQTPLINHPPRELVNKYITAVPIDSKSPQQYLSLSVQ